jgi:hypothetical protein
MGTDRPRRIKQVAAATAATTTTAKCGMQERTEERDALSNAVEVVDGER